MENGAQLAKRPRVAHYPILDALFSPSSPDAAPTPPFAKQDLDQDVSPHVPDLPRGLWFSDSSPDEDHQDLPDSPSPPSSLSEPEPWEPDSLLRALQEPIDSDPSTPRDIRKKRLTHTGTEELRNHRDFAPAAACPAEARHPLSDDMRRSIADAMWALDQMIPVAVFADRMLHDGPDYSFEELLEHSLGRISCLVTREQPFYIGLCMDPVHRFNIGACAHARKWSTMEVLVVSNASVIGSLECACIANHRHAYHNLCRNLSQGHERCPRRCDGFARYLYIVS
jgi:hypothetical protein